MVVRGSSAPASASTWVGVRPYAARLASFLPAGALYVGRSAPGLPASRYANRHRVGACRVCQGEHDQAAAVTAYTAEFAARAELVDVARAELAGMGLACWCLPGAGPCHGDVLVLVAAGVEPADALQRVLAEPPAMVGLW